MKTGNKLSINSNIINEGIIYRVSKEIKVDSIGNKESATKIVSLKNMKINVEKKKESVPLFYPMSVEESLKKFNSKWSYAGVFIPYAYSLSIRVILPFTPKEVFVFQSEKVTDDVPLNPVPIREPKVYSPRVFYYNFKMVRRGGYFIGWVPPNL
ncbi:hypothetical protein [Sulfuracidifex tepidarius]|uniref:Uncharacterized protein n=1 Tax=Sulfuracidifex tepidarius TaxID=1294262 RepID=A0A510DY89_9CREN|nr:hypothetical protein [Sulfuracidifex tepidarius]BBG25196.1 hypothetical protein IC006_2531 [Sulfuracidifex tepidarius]BBG27989.1 hypothetical protein IC007_2544 [Sulfuracidifex tepidarius]